MYGVDAVEDAPFVTPINGTVNTFNASMPYIAVNSIVVTVSEIDNSSTDFKHQKV